MKNLWSYVLIVSVVTGGSASWAAAPRLGAILPSPITDEDFYESGKPSAAKVELGRMLFFDKILSGNRNIACATCHHPQHGTSDGLALSLGEGPTGLGPERRPGDEKRKTVHGRVPRNSPALFNKGAREFRRMFHDGRVEEDTEGYYDSGFISPVKWKLPEGLENTLAAQAMFPVTSADEMAGQKGENEVANASALARAAGSDGVWDRLARRLADVPEYVLLFRNAFPETIRGGEDIEFVHAANAIAAFEGVAFRSDQSPFDRYLRGQDEALSPVQRKGLELFYGRAGCSECHSGKFQTDQKFHAIAMPQIGPGKGDGNDGAYWRASGQRGFVEDFGRGRVTKRSEDFFRFRTPSLRNVEVTGPWGHAGAYADLESVVRHHLDPEKGLEQFDPRAVDLVSLPRVVEITAERDTYRQEYLDSTRLEGFLLRDRFVQLDPKLRARIREANELQSVRLSDAEVRAIVAFLQSLTDPMVRQLDQWIPERVPSGLPVHD